ncbi:MAG: hypothetical protein CVV47_00380 [Spirochaetae bacterium HGW-Spirochaetae-3]|jgi:predicted anti-sigma-YlaC factor YlaD|nr:MAG: hypothetical protein CVV47_00380 [Spirochaetae bacterium HGW-Spirochaetae-3]
MRRSIALTLSSLVFLGSCALLKAGDYASAAFMRENDPELAEAAFPAMIKASEALSLADPGDDGKAVMTASLYVMYANAFLDGRAFALPDDAYEEKRALSLRAVSLYRRAAILLVPRVEKRAPGIFGDGASLSRFGRDDVPLLYWTAAAVLSAFAGDPVDFDNAARVGGAVAIFEKARALDPGWNGGAIDELAITIYGSLPRDLGGDPEKAVAAFAAAKAATDSASPGPYVAYAYSVCVAAGDAEGFASALETALELDGRPGSALMDALARRKASRLLADAATYF